jgi:membrane protease YdiL (CAAX protease family)
MVSEEVGMGETCENVEVNEEPAAVQQRPGVIARVFRNRFGHWRAGWRLLVYVIAVFVVGKSVSTVLKLWISSPADADFSSWHHAVIWVVADVGLVVAALLLLKWFDRRPPALLGLGFGPGWLRETGLGLAGGLVATGALVGVMSLTGSVSLELTSDLAASLSAMIRYLFIFTVAAAAEELVFRGYPLQVLAEGSRGWAAGLLLCLVFTWGHLGNPDVTFVGIANIFLAAVVLTVLYFQTRRLWLPIAFHLSWNFAQSWLWGFDVSGIKIRDQLFAVTPRGHDLMTGGEFGLEGSVLSAGFFVALIAWLLVRRPVSPSPRVAAMWAAVPTGFGLAPPIDAETARPAATAKRTTGNGDGDGGGGENA